MTTDGDRIAREAAAARQRVALSANEDTSPSKNVRERFGGRMLGDIMDRPGALNDVRAMIPRLAYPDRVTLFSARDKAGKSTFTSAGVAGLSMSGPFLGERCEIGKTVWIAAEEHEDDLAKRLSDQGAHRDRIVIYGKLDRPLDDLDEIVADERPDSVVVDTLPTFVESLIEGSADTGWSKIMSRFTRIARAHHCAVILPTHSNKNKPGYRDSTRIGAGVDVILEMTAPDEGSPIRNFTAKARFTRMPAFSVRLADNGLYELVSGELSLEARTYAAIAGNPGISKNSVRKAVGGNASATDATVTRLRAIGRIENRGTDDHQKWYVVDAGHTSGHTTEQARPNVKPLGHGVDTVETHHDGGGVSGTDPLRGDDLDTPVDSVLDNYQREWDDE